MERQGKYELAQAQAPAPTSAPSPDNDCPLTPPELAVLRQFFELLDHWDRKETQEPE